MSLKRFAKIISGQSVLDRIQDAIAGVLNPLAINPSLQRSILSNVALVVGMNSVPHLLFRLPLGWNISRLRSDSLVWETKDFDAKFLYLSVTTPVVVDIEVF